MLLKYLLVNFKCWILSIVTVTVGILEFGFFYFNFSRYNIELENGRIGHFEDMESHQKIVLVMSQLLLYYSIIITDVAADTGLSESHKTKLSNHFLSYGIGCIGQYNLNIEDLTALKALELPKDDNSYCFFACVLKKAELMDANGKISADSSLRVMKNVFPDDRERNEIVKVFVSCAFVNDAPVKDGARGCEIAKLILKCLVDNANGEADNTSDGKRVIRKTGLHHSIGRVIRSLLLLGCDTVVGDNLPGRIIGRILPGRTIINFLCSFLLKD